MTDPYELGTTVEDSGGVFVTVHRFPNNYGAYIVESYGNPVLYVAVFNDEGYLKITYNTDVLDDDSVDITSNLQLQGYLADIRDLPEASYLDYEEGGDHDDNWY